MPEETTIKRAARSMQIHQWSPGFRVSWTVDSLKNAMLLHQDGDFTESAKLVDTMWMDDELPTSLDSATNYIVGADFKMEPVTGPDGEPIAESAKMAELFGEKWEASYPAHFMGNILNWFSMLGAAPGTIDWEQGADGMLHPYPRVLHPEFLRWDSELRDPMGCYGGFKYETRDGEQIVSPGDGKWILLSDGRESWMRCGVRALGQTWLAKQFTIRDWARYNERHGLPIVKAMVPAVAGSDDKLAFFNDVKTLGRDTTVLNPVGFGENETLGFDLDLVEAKDQAFDTFRQTIERCDRKFQVYFLGTNTNELIGTAGSRATSESGRSISMNKALERWRRVQSDIRDQLLKPWIALNFPGFDLELTPWPNYLIEGDEDLKVRAETNKLFFESLNAAKTAGYDIKNLEEESAQYGVELEERPPEPMPEMVPGQPPTAGSNSNGRPQMSKEELDAIVNGDGIVTCGTAVFATDDGPPPVDQVGERDGFVAGQRYIDGLADNLAKEAAELERIEAETMVEILDASKTPEELRANLAQYVSEDDPIQMANVFNKATLLSELAGRFASQEDL